MIESDTQLLASEFDVATPSTVHNAAQQFAAALVETPQYRAYEAASATFQGDAAAQASIAAYQRKLESLRMMLMLNAVEPDQRAELESLYKAFALRPSVIAFGEAQQEFATLCRLSAGLLSQHVGLDFAAACGSSCCG